MSATKPNVYLQTVVLVSIERREGGALLGGEDGLVTRLLMWASKQRVYAVAGHSHIGPNFFSALYEPEDAERVRQWLAEQPETRSFGPPSIAP